MLVSTFMRRLCSVEFGCLVSRVDHRFSLGPCACVADQRQVMGAAFRAPIAVSIPAIAGLLLYCTILDGYMMVVQILTSMLTVTGNYIFGLLILKIIFGGSKKPADASAA